MNKLVIVKAVAGIVTGFGVSKITNDVLRSAVTINSTTDQVRALVGTFVLGSMIAGAAEKHVNARIDSAAKFLADRKNSKNTDTDMVVEAA